MTPTGEERADFPTELKVIDDRVEKWRSDLLQSLGHEHHVDSYLLILAVCRRLASEFRHLGYYGESGMDLAELSAHQILEAASFALRGFKGTLHELPFQQQLINASIAGQDIDRAWDVVQSLTGYVHWRDALLTYRYGGYELAEVSPDHIRFTNPVDWPGFRDRAQHVIVQHLKSEPSPTLSDGGDAATTMYDVPRTWDLGGLTSQQFVEAWNGLVRHYGGRWGRNGQVPVKERRQWSTELARSYNLNDGEAGALIDLLEFDGTRQTLALGLMHCPMVRLTATSLALVPPALVFGNPRVLLPRLLAKRARRDESLADYLQEKLRMHYAGTLPHWQSDKHYTHQGTRYDVDLVVFEPNTNRLLLAQLKAFIPPDSGYEVIQANKKLQEGIQQAQKSSEWLAGLSWGKWSDSLGVPLATVHPAVHLAVIGNGFAGSDYIKLPSDIEAVSADQLLQRRYAGGSVITAIRESAAEIKEMAELQRLDAQPHTFRAAGVAVELPA